MKNLIFFQLFSIVLCWDYYVGMFKKNDLLVAQDTLYKDKRPFGKTVAKYGRLFKCPITYFRIVDRLGFGREPRIEIIRGGLQRKNLVLKITSAYNLPLSVNLYVGCENKIKMTTAAVTTAEEQSTPANGTQANGTQADGGVTGGTGAAGTGAGTDAGTGAGAATTAAGTAAP